MKHSQLMSSIVSFYQGLALVQVLPPFHMWKLRFHGVYSSPTLNHVWIQSSKYELLRYDSNFRTHEKEAKKSN